MRKIAAFMRRDFQIDLSYRFSFVVQVTWVLISTAAYYFLARSMGQYMDPARLEAYGGSYFAFILIGVALNDYHATSVHVFSQSVRESQLTGTLESLLTTQTSMSTIILSSALYPFLWTSLRVILYLVCGVILFKMPLALNQGVAAAMVLLLSVLVFSCLGILSAAFILVFKRSSPIPFVLEALAWLLGGVLYPVSVLPDWLRRLSGFLPITHAIEGMRAALMGAGSWEQVRLSLLSLLLMAGVLLPLSLLGFIGAARHVRKWGTLAQY